MQCLACYRDKRGIITHCKLSSNGIEKVFPKDEVKAMLRQKNKIDMIKIWYTELPITKYTVLIFNTSSVVAEKMNIGLA